MRQAGLIFFFVFLTTGQVLAACPAGSATVLSCTAKGGARALDVCLDNSAGTISYTYGGPNRPPELSLTRQIAEIEHQPWPGIGRSIWEATVFYNKGYAYEVYTSVDRLAEDQPVSGGVLLRKNGADIAQIDCDAGTAEIGLWAVTDAKEGLGLCWNQPTDSWNACTE